MLVDHDPTVDHVTASPALAIEDKPLTDHKLTEEVPATAEKVPFKVAEFFAGIGLVRLGLEESGFQVVWANDIERDKHDMYVGNFDDAPGSHHYELGDVADVKGSHLPQPITLAWASFPCTDLSLAGGRKGLQGKHSGTFWEFTRIIKEMDDSRPPLVALENVNGFATSHGGEDIKAAIRELNSLGYSVDILTLDARRFVPQSRPRLFLVAVQEFLLKEFIASGSEALHSAAETDPTPILEPNPELRPSWLQKVFHDESLTTHHIPLPEPPPMRQRGLSDIVESVPEGDERWWDETRTKAFIAQLSPVQLDRVSALQDQAKESVYRTAYRRTRNGKPAWEIRPDDIAGCLRTARGGSSKQAVVRLKLGDDLRVRWMTPLEYARLMGAGDYRIDTARRNQALFGFGDAVCVPAVKWLADHYLKPLADFSSRRREMNISIGT